MRKREGVRTEEVIIGERLFCLILITILLFLLSIYGGGAKGIQGVKMEDNAIYIQVIKDGKDEGVYTFPPSSQSRLKDLYKKMGLEEVKGLEGHLVTGSKVVIQGGEVIFKPMDGKKRLLFGMPVDINSAEIEDLKALPGIGEKLAIRLIKRREEIGGFHTFEDLKGVKGLGDKKVDAIKDLITFDGTMP